MQSVHTLLKLAQLRWTGHATRMLDERLPKKVLYGELQEGKRSQGGQKKCYKDTLKASLKDFNIPTESWEQAAQDRTKWRCLINKGASQFEAKRICEAERKRKGMKARAKGPSSDSTSPNSLALFATDSLEPRLAYTTIFFFFYSKSPPLTFRRTVYRRSYGNLCRILVCVSSIYNGDKYLHC